VLSLNSIITDIKGMLLRLICEDVELLTELEPAIDNVHADHGQIEQVIMNLAVNARDAMPDGGKLTIKTGNVYLDEEYARRHLPVRPGSYVMLAVSDTGEGMDAETRARIFEPFYTDSAIVHHGGLEEGVAFIEKPLTGENLARKVPEVLDAEKKVLPDE
jgi:signal transduction histidine kinase